MRHKLQRLQRLRASARQAARARGDDDWRSIGETRWGAYVDDTTGAGRTLRDAAASRALFREVGLRVAPGDDLIASPRHTRAEIVAELQAAGIYHDQWTITCRGGGGAATALGGAPRHRAALRGYRQLGVPAGHNDEFVVPFVRRLVDGPGGTGGTQGAVGHVRAAAATPAHHGVGRHTAMRMGATQLVGHVMRLTQADVFANATRAYGAAMADAALQTAGCGNRGWGWEPGRTALQASLPLRMGGLGISRPPKGMAAVATIRGGTRAAGGRGGAGPGRRRAGPPAGACRWPHTGTCCRRGRQWHRAH
eukprot:g6229.t1